MTTLQMLLFGRMISWSYSENKSISIWFLTLELHLKYFWLASVARCMKITEKVSFNITSQACYVYSFNGQKLIENAK